MLVLGLETSCDETSAAVVNDGQVLSNVVSSQVDLHAAWGGVVPEIASRQHLRLVDTVVRQACAEAGLDPARLQAVAVTRGPGLPSALLVGTSAARGIAARLGLPLVPIHHVEAHLYSPSTPATPLVALIVSGGHTLLIRVRRFGEHEVLGTTVDDAAGEAFDKAAQMLRLPYPGGPAIEKAARNGSPRAFDFPRPMLNSGDWNFSFSGLKTAVRRAVHQLGEQAVARVPDLAASFQAAVIEVLVAKTLAAARACRVEAVALSGGVACNGALQAEFQARCRKEGLAFFVAERKFCTDNGAMIALLAERKLQQGFRPPEDWDIQPDWSLQEA